MDGAKRIFLTGMALLLFILGLIFCLYPAIYGSEAERNAQQAVTIFRQQPDSAVPPQPAEAEKSACEEARAHLALWDAVCAYNARIWEERQASLDSAEAYAVPSFILSDFHLDSEVFAVLSIPKLALEMPVYLGASSRHMEIGAAHLTGTSLPVGGTNTNCVIAAHRGWGSADYFRRLPELQPGDTVTISNLWETLTYTVTETKIIAPNDVESILIQKNEDLLTLLTCCSVAGIGKQRYLVLCTRNSDERSAP